MQGACKGCVGHCVFAVGLQSVQWVGRAVREHCGGGYGVCKACKGRARCARGVQEVFKHCVGHPLCLQWGYRACNGLGWL